MSIEQQIDLYLRARCTLLFIVTSEEERVIHVIQEMCDDTDRACMTCDVAEGFHVLGKKGKSPSARDPISALEQVDKAEGKGLFILKDFHECLGNAQIKRKLRSVVQRLKFSSKSIVITMPISTIPDELRDEAVVIDFPPPTSTELDRALEDLIQASGLKMNLDQGVREKLVQAAVGLTAAQAKRVFAKAIVEDGVLDDRDIDLVTQEKKQIIRESEALEFYTVTETIADVGGLDILKSWLGLREKAFGKEARDYGLPWPKGIALIGIPGTGKSLTAKMIGGLWHLPVLRLDVGSLFGSLVGESEERARRALRLAETTAPCILWIDELEKALAHGDNDSGTSTRVFGTILTWMQEKKAPCFVVATANNIHRLPPELLRKGRFDEIFFLDLPTQQEREEIFAVHLRKRNRLTNDFDVPKLAKLAEGYVGAEIEQAIIDAMYVGFGAGREFTSDDIAESIKRQVPLSVSQRENISALRNWLREGRAQSASFQEMLEAEQQFVPLEMGSPHGTD